MVPLCVPRWQSWSPPSLTSALPACIGWHAVARGLSSGAACRLAFNGKLILLGSFAEQLEGIPIAPLILGQHR